MERVFLFLFLVSVVTAVIALGAAIISVISNAPPFETGFYILAFLVCLRQSDDLLNLL